MWITDRSRTEGSPTLPRGHIPALDALRGVAVLAVLLYHFGSHTAPEGTVGRLTSTLLRLGGSGVDLFFVLSGFLITGILYDSKGRGRYFRDFYVRRSLRIFPLYYVVLIGGLLVLPALGVGVDAGPASDRPWLWVYGTNAVQATRGAYVFGWFDHFWSLAVEEHFYLVWPLVIAALGRRAAMGASLGCVATAVVSRWALVANGDHAIAAYVATPCRLDALAVGAFLALAARGPGGIGRPVAVGDAEPAGLRGAARLAGHGQVGPGGDGRRLAGPAVHADVLVLRGPAGPGGRRADGAPGSVGV